jgi:Flp pilus assembly protein TadG
MRPGIRGRSKVGAKIETRRKRRIFAWRRSDSDEGSVIVEFALVFPIFAIMLFGMIQFGLVFNGWTSLRNSVQIQARLASIGEFGSDSGCAQGLAVTPPVPSSSDETSEDMLCAAAGQIGQPVGTSNDAPDVGLLLQDNLVTVCAQSESESLTGFVPTLALSSTSTFYVESTGQVLVPGADITAPVTIGTPGDLDYQVDDNGYSFDGIAQVKPETYDDLPSLVVAVNAAIASSEAANNVSTPDFKAVLVTNGVDSNIDLDASTGSYMSLLLTGGDAATPLGFNAPFATETNGLLQTANPYGLSACLGLSINAPSTAAVGQVIDFDNDASNIVGTLGGTRDSAGGSISFTVFYTPPGDSTAPTTCTSGGQSLGTATMVSGDGPYNPVTPFTPSEAGNYWWYASYSGDTNNSGVNSVCGSGMPETVAS